MHHNSVLLFQKYARPLFRGGLKVLEIGPDAVPSTYQSLVADATITWDTLDLARAYHRDRLTYRAESEYAFPLASDAYDIVLSGQVIEHVRKTWLWIGEVARVCKPGGHVITLNPINWPYHEAPVDCWRIYPEGMRALYEEAGLTVSLAVVASLDLEEHHRAIRRRVRLFVRRARLMARRLVPGPPGSAPDAWDDAYAIDGITIGAKGEPNLS